MNKSCVNKYLLMIQMMLSSISLFMICFSLRHYIYDNVNSTFTFVRLGIEKLSVSVLVPILLVVGIIIGIVFVCAFYKKLNKNVINVVYSLSALCISIVILWFDPYTVASAFRNQNLQNVTSVCLIAAMAFGVISSIGFVFSIFGQIILKIQNSSKSDNYIYLVGIILCFVIALLSEIFKGSFVLAQWILLVGILVLSIVLSFLDKEEGTSISYIKELSKTQSIISLEIISCIIVAIVLGAIITESVIVF